MSIAPAPRKIPANILKIMSKERFSGNKCPIALTVRAGVFATVYCEPENVNHEQGFDAENFAVQNALTMIQRWHVSDYTTGESTVEDFDDSDSNIIKLYVEEFDNDTEHVEDILTIRSYLRSFNIR